jgi:putative NADPH-quinone reductase
MKNLIIFAHPESKNSHNGKILQIVKEKLEENKEETTIIDLYGEKFDPLVSKEEWSGIQNKTVQKYQNLVKEAHRLIFIYPVWWYGAPAILKGFFDRVFTNGFAYNFQKEEAIHKIGKMCFGPLCGTKMFYPIFNSFLPVKRHLQGKSALIIRTYGGEKEAKELYGCATEYNVDKAILELCGIKVEKVEWFKVRGNNFEVPKEIRGEIENKLSK